MNITPEKEAELKGRIVIVEAEIARLQIQQTKRFAILGGYRQAIATIKYAIEELEKNLESNR